MIGAKQLMVLATFSIVILGLGETFFQVEKEPGTSVDEMRETALERNAPISKEVEHTRSNSEEMRQLSNNYRQIRGGFSTHGFIDVDESNGHVFYHASYRESTVYRYTSLANFISNTGQQQFNLPRQSEGTYHCIYRNHLYYAQYNSNTLVKCAIGNMNLVLTRNLAGAGSHNQAHFNWGGYTDINLMSDETGLYVTWAQSTSQPMQLSKLDENLNVQRTWNTGWNKGSVGWAFMVGGVLYWGNQFSSAAFNYKYDTATSQRTTYSNSLGANGYITHTSYNARDNSLLVWNQGNVYHYPEIGGVRITRAENAVLRGTENDEGIVYAGYSSYILSVNITTTESLDDASEMAVWLDYNTTNATLGFNWTREEFYKLQDVNGHVRLFTDNCTFANDGEERWWVNFSIMFNFTFPHEKMVDCFVKTVASTGDARLDRFKDVCRVENDLEFMGTPEFTGEEQGKLEMGRWVKGGQNITVSNLTVVYSDSPSLYPDDEFFNVRIMDGTGSTWWSNRSSGEEIVMDIRSKGVTDTDEEFFITIENIPEAGICKTNLTYPLKIDAEAPLPPFNLLCHADSFKGRDTQFTDEPEMFVTWDGVTDPGSGLLGYYYSSYDNSGTDNGSFTNETEVELDKLKEGYSPVHVWCVDNVGNIGGAASAGMLVDLTPPAFTNFTPPDGSWHNAAEVECSVEVRDGEGSGVDGTTVEYAVSTGDGHNFDMWMPSGLIAAGNILVPNIRHFFGEGEENYIKWRARDVSGNGYVESFPVNIKVDITPVSFAKELSAHANWYDTRRIESIITVSDEGIGVNISNLEARVSTSGPGEFGEWMNIDPENITEMNQGEYEIRFTGTYGEGKDNYVMFRGTDLVGNPYSVSDKFNLRVDSSPAYFGDFVPDGDTYSDEQEVECFIQIFDDGSGVDVNTVEYSISKDGSREGDFGAWKRAQNVVGGNPTQVLMELKFDWGRNNYVRWRAGDKMATGLNVSPPYRIWINSEPTPLISQPFSESDLWSHVEITFDARNSSDRDGDNLTFHWSSNVSMNRSIGSGARVTRKLAPGKHTVTLYVNDGHGYNVTEKLFITVKEKKIDGGPPEKEEGALFSEDGGLSIWAMMAMAILLLLIIILVIWILVRKKKKEEEPPPSPMPPPTPYSPYSQPYGQGQYFPTTGPGYVQQGFTGAISQGAPPSAYPPMGGFPGQLQLPPGHMGAVSTPVAPALPATGTVSPNYMLPSFTTDQGMQDFNRLALPPASVDGTLQGYAETGMPAQQGPSENTVPTLGMGTQTSFPDVGQDMSALFGPGPSEMPDYSPGPSASPTVPEQPGIPAFPDLFSDVGAEPLPPPVPSTDPSVGDPSGYVPVPAMEPTPVPAPVFPYEMTMQCHACGNNHTAVITQLPIIVECSVCQTQGMIEG